MRAAIRTYIGRAQQIEASEGSTSPPRFGEAPLPLRRRRGGLRGRGWPLASPFASRAKDQPQAGTAIAEGAAQGVLEIPLIAVLDKRRVVDEEDEGRRVNAHLGDVEQLQASLAGKGRRPAGHGPAHRGVELARLDPL